MVNPSGGGARDPRRGERGQALLIALLALFLASMAAGFVAEDLALRERALQEEIARAHLRGLLDGAMAEGLAYLAIPRPLPAGVRPFAGGTLEMKRQPISHVQLWLLVRATYAGRAGAAYALVWLSPTGPRVQSWHRMPASAYGP